MVIITKKYTTKLIRDINKKIVIICFLSTCIFPMHAIAQNNISTTYMPGAGLCINPIDHEVQVNINVKYGVPKYDYSLSRQQIAQKITAQKAKEMETTLEQTNSPDHTAGLTAVLFNTQISAKVDATKQRNGYCVTLSSIDVDMGYNDIIVYIDRNFPEGTCPYNVTLAHENTHVGIHQKALEFYTPYIGEAIYDAAQNISSVYVRSLDNVQEIITKMAQDIGTQAKPSIDFFLNARNAENAKLDTPENYQYTQNMCTDWHKYR